MKVLGKAVPSFTSTQLEQSSGPADDFTIKWSAMTLYSAGADTVVSALHSFVLALTLFPHVQRRAQEEIDRVIGNDRLPTMVDRGRLPYVDAVIKEVYRWKPATPLGGINSVITHLLADYVIQASLTLYLKTMSTWNTIFRRDL